MSKPYKDFEPKWITQAPDKKSFRAIMKWGDPAIYKAPKEGLYKLIKQQFDLTDDDFKTMVDTGEDTCDVHVESALTKEQIDAISAIVGKENATTDDFERVRLAYGKTMIDIIALEKALSKTCPTSLSIPALPIKSKVLSNMPMQTASRSTSTQADRVSRAAQSLWCLPTS